MKDKLLFSVGKKDLRIEYFSGTGAGGQARNKNQNCVRIHHDESGALVTGQSQRDRKANLTEALYNLVKHPKFKLWQTRRIFEINEGKTIEQMVEELMDEKNLKVEIFKNGEWFEENINNK